MKLTFIPPSRTIQSILVFLLSVVSFSLNGQQDFNHFQTLVAKGEIPDDFIQSTISKIDLDLFAKKNQISSDDCRKNVEAIHYNVDYLLHSGYVIYGDEISLYVQSVAANLLKNEPELLTQLRFYTIKSNDPSVISTDQGIIFVTTGLISQLTSEAQLAFVMSREIVHFSEKHLVEDVNWDPTSRRLLKLIIDLRNHSIANEFEADRLALKRYNDASYSLDEAYSSFNVLMYSHLPFDELPFKEEYYSSEKMFIPNSYFATKEYPIISEEDYDDRFSSYPSIKSRKDSMEYHLTNMNAVGGVLFSLGKEKFEYARNLARFESVRSEILENNYAKALYNILLLESKYPHSIYLKRMKALSWLGFVQYGIAGFIQQTIPTTKTFEGESAKMYYFFSRLNEDSFNTMALRIIYDLKKENPDDLMINAIMDELSFFLIARTHFSLDQYSTTTFSQNEHQFLASKNTQLNDEKTTNIPLSKYDKIRANKTDAGSATSVFDSTKFQIYALSDIVSDTVFQGYFKKMEESRRMNETDQISYKTLGGSVGDFHVEIDSCILLGPSTYLSKHKGIGWMEQLHQFQKDEFLKQANKNQLVVRLLEVSESYKTSDFNDYITLNIYFKQLMNAKLNYCMPVDYDSVMLLSEKLNISKAFLSTITFPDNAAIHRIRLVDLATGKIHVYGVIEDQFRPTPQRVSSIYEDFFDKLKNKH